MNGDSLHFEKWVEVSFVYRECVYDTHLLRSCLYLNASRMGCDVWEEIQYDIIYIHHSKTIYPFLVFLYIAIFPWFDFIEVSH